MTASQLGGLSSALKNVDCRCLDTAEVIGTWLAQNPDVDPREAAFHALCTGRVPFPSVAGNPPVYRDRPYFDSRGREANGRPH
jgi:hypothetical protein